MLVNQLKLYYRATFNRVSFWKKYRKGRLRSHVMTTKC